MINQVAAFSTWIIPASPLAKVFQEHCHERLLDDPDWIFSDDPFDILIPRASGVLRYTYGKPIHIKPIGSEKEEDLISKVHWLTGGPSGDESIETDSYGIVQLPVDLDFMSNLAVTIEDSISTSSDKKEKATKKEKDLRSQLLSANKKAREIADARVMKKIRNMYQVIVEQRKRAAETGAKYFPSLVERLCIHVLAKEIKRDEDRMKKFEDQFEKSIEKINAVEA
jgi:CRISPR/Cas system CSM-associated protein Csm2 small subunit